MKDKDGKELTTQETLQKVGGRVTNATLETGVFLLHLAGYLPSHNLRKLLYRVGGVKIGVDRCRAQSAPASATGRKRLPVIGG